MVWPKLPCRPTTLDIVTIEPRFLRSSLREAARQTWKVPPRLTSMTRSQSSGVIREIRLSRVIPALATRFQRSSPRASSAWSTIAAACSGSATSPPIATAVPPAAVISATTASAASRLAA